MAIPKKFEDLANAVRDEIYGKDVREAIAKSIEETGESSETAIKITEQLIDGSFDEGILNTEIEQRLEQIEEDYAPELNNVKSQLAQIAVDVKSFGAVGDYDPETKTGTDDSQAIQTAIDSLKGGDRLLFPEGNYLVKDINFNKNGVVFEGKGKGITQFYMSDENVEGLGVIEGNDIHFKNIGFNGGGNTAYGQYMLDVVENTKGVRFSDCYFGNIRGRGEESNTGGQYVFRVNLNGVELNVNNSVFTDVSNIGDKVAAGYGFAGFIFFGGGEPTTPTIARINKNEFDNCYTEFDGTWTHEEKEQDVDGDAIRFYYIGEHPNKNRLDVVIKENEYKRCQKRAIKVTGVGGIDVEDSIVDFSGNKPTDPIASCFIRVLNGGNININNTNIKGPSKWIVDIDTTENIEMKKTKYVSSHLNENRVFYIKDSNKCVFGDIEVEYNVSNNLTYYNGFFLLLGDIDSFHVENVTIKNNGDKESDSYFLRGQATGILKDVTITNIKTVSIRRGVRLDGDSQNNSISIKDFNAFGCDMLVDTYGEGGWASVDGLLFENIKLATNNVSTIIRVRGTDANVQNVEFINVEIKDSDDRMSENVFDLSDIDNLRVENFNYVGTHNMDDDDALVRLARINGVEFSNSRIPSMATLTTVDNGFFNNNLVGYRFYIENSSDTKFINNIVRQETSVSAPSNTNVISEGELVY